MKYLIFSDLHGNADALTAMLSAIENISIDGYIFCGDLAGYYYDAHKIVEIFAMLRPLYSVKGNHDQLYCQVFRNQTDSKALIEKYGHSYAQIDPFVVRYIEQFSEKLEFNIQGYRALLVHGSPQDPLNGRIYPDTHLDREIIPAGFDFVFCGHTHYRMLQQIGYCNLINPGSLGQPRDGKGFSFAVLDCDRRTLSYRSVVINESSLIQKVELYDQENQYLKNILFRKRNGQHETYFYY